VRTSTKTAGGEAADEGQAVGFVADITRGDTQAAPRSCALLVVRYLGSVTWQPMSLAIETERLTLRLRDERDAAWYRELIGERGEDTPTLEEATTRLARFRDLTIETGIGALAICRRAEGDVIGYCALVVGRCSLDEPEIAYELLRRFHGRGYATEAAQALVAAAAATGRHRLWSTVRPWNAASLRVLEKIGFRRDHSITDDRGDVVYLVRDL
jgi:RimJ/RimL family protein N-acetyltransferase